MIQVNHLHSHCALHYENHNKKKTWSKSPVKTSVRNLINKCGCSHHQFQLVINAVS